MFVGRDKQAVAVNNAHGNGGCCVDGIKLNGSGNARRIQRDAGNNAFNTSETHEPVPIIKQRHAAHLKQKQHTVALAHVVANNIGKSARLPVFVHKRFHGHLLIGNIHAKKQGLAFNSGNAKNSRLQGNIIAIA